MIKPIWILGAGGHAQSVLNILSQLNLIGFLEGFIVDHAEHDSDSELLKPVMNESDAIVKLIDKNINLIHGFIPSPLKQKQINIELFIINGFNFSGFISPNVTVPSSSFLGEGVQIFNNCYLGPHVSISEHVTLNTASVIEHNVQIGGFTFIGPTACVLGGVSIGKRVYVGAGSTILPGIRIGDDSTIGAGSLVTKDVMPGKKVFGVPAVQIN
jgi:sugar O-acyltransferase (sialic acid O-acetyltransferase NeuD family)